METKTIKQFKEETYYDVIKNIMDANGGYITSRIITDLGIHRMFLKKMLERGEIIKVTSGVYSYSNAKSDDLYVLQQRYPKIIYTGITGLIIHGIINNSKEKFNIALPFNYHVPKLDNNYKVLKANSDNYDLNIIERSSVLNHSLKVYNIERCVCDIIKHYKLFSSEEIKEVLLKIEKKGFNEKVFKDYIEKYNLEGKLSKVLKSLDIKLSNGVWNEFINKKGNTKI